MMKHPVTPDGHYFVVRGRLWRCTNPNLPASCRVELTKQLMAARRAVAAARDDAPRRRAARQAVQDAKVALGERGTPWWGVDEKTYDRYLVVNTPYRDWYERQCLDTAAVKRCDPA